MLYDHIKKTVVDLGYSNFTLETVSFLIDTKNPWYVQAYNELYFVQSLLNPSPSQTICAVHFEANNSIECLYSDVITPKFYATFFTGQIKVYRPQDVPSGEFVYVNLLRCIPTI